jgi:hypothetical protein
MSYEQRARVDTPDGRRSSDADFVDGFVAVYVDHEPWKDAARKQLSERLASIAAEAREQAIEEAAGKLKDLAPFDRPLWEREHRDAWLAIRALAPRPGLRLVAREDLAKVIEAAETFVNNSSLVCVEIRKAINRLRAGEE